MLGSILGDVTGQPFPRSYMERIRSAGTFLRWILDENDNHPGIGDDDEGRVIFSPQDSSGYVPSVLQAAAALCSAADIAPMRSYPHQIGRASCRERVCQYV